MNLFQEEVLLNICHQLERGCRDMKKVIYSIVIIMLLFIWSVVLISCQAITAQNININPADGFKINQGMNGGPSITGKARMSDNAHKNLNNH